MRLAQISDLHFAKVAFSPLQFFSKRWIGNVNLVFKRKWKFSTDPLWALIPLWKEAGVEKVVICGDLATTSMKKEFALARAFVEKIRETGMEVICLPGNHDTYTKHSYKKKLFYRFFPSPKGKHFPFSFSLKEDGVEVAPLHKGWWLVTLDTAIATPLFSSRGHFLPAVEEKLKELLQQIPREDAVVLATHFPFFSCETPRKELLRADALKAVVKNYPQIKLFLHGHTHQHIIADLRASGLPIILDGGSASCRKQGTFNLIDISEKSCEVAAYKSAASGWEPFKKTSFAW